MIDYPNYMKKIIILCFLSYVLISNINAQNKKNLDSLMRIYKTAKHDTTKILALKDIASEYRNSKPDTCIALVEKSLQISEKINFEKGKAWAWNIMGIVYVDKGKYPDALSYYQKALPIFEKVQDKKGIASTLNNIGSIYYKQGNYPSALEYYQKSMKIQEVMGNKRGIASNLSNIGNIYTNQGDYLSALEYYQKSLKIREAIGDKRGTTVTLNNIGVVYETQGNYLLSLEYHQKSLKIKETIGDKQGIAASLNNIGNIYNNQKNYPLALEYQQKSLKIQEEIDDKLGMTYSFSGIGVIYQKQKDYDKSIEYSQKSLQVAKQIKALLEIKEVSKILFETYKLKGDYVKALEYLELYKNTNDSLFNAEKSKVIANLESTAKLERKEKEIMLLNKNQEILEKDNGLQKSEKERERNERLAIEKQKEANEFIALAQQEKDKRKQDSLYHIAQQKQLEADKFWAESKAQKIQIQQAKQAKEAQKHILYVVLAGLVVALILAYLAYRSRQAEKYAKETMAEQKQEIQQMNEELTIQTEHLEEANNTKNKLFSILGHDLRSPIGSLESILNLMNIGLVTQEEFEVFVPRLHRNVKNMQSTLENLLQWSITQMEGINANPVSISVQEMAEEQVQLFGEVGKAKNIQIVAEIPESTIVWADVNHLRLVLRNLVNNALKFTRENGKIKIVAQSTLKTVTISVEDNGVGMSNQQLGKIFQKNQSFTTYGTGGEKGTGLGLQLCQEIVKENKGEIWATSEKDKGSIFSFRLPTQM